MKKKKERLIGTEIVQEHLFFFSVFHIMHFFFSSFAIISFYHLCANTNVPFGFDSIRFDSTQRD